MKEYLAAFARHDLASIRDEHLGQAIVVEVDGKVVTQGRETIFPSYQKDFVRVTSEARLVADRVVEVGLEACTPEEKTQLTVRYPSRQAAMTNRPPCAAATQFNLLGDTILESTIAVLSRADLLTDGWYSNVTKIECGISRIPQSSSPRIPVIKTCSESEAPVPVVPFARTVGSGRWGNLTVISRSPFPAAPMMALP